MFNRRLFLKFLLTAPVAITSLISSTSVIATQSRQAQRTLLNKCSIAGFQYYQGNDVFNYLNKNDVLTLLAEPENKHDKYAVEVYYKDQKLGYLPKTDNKHISRLLQADIPLICEVTTINPEKYSWNVVDLSIYLVQ